MQSLVIFLLFVSFCVCICPPTSYTDQTGIVSYSVLGNQTESCPISLVPTTSGVTSIYFYVYSQTVKLEAYGQQQNITWNMDDGYLRFYSIYYYYRRIFELSGPSANLVLSHTPYNSYADLLGTQFSYSALTNGARMHPFRTIPCNFYKPIDNYGMIVDDGSGTGPYSNNFMCSFNISSGPNGLAFAFLNFSLGAGDFLRVTQDGVVIHTFGIGNNPARQTFQILPSRSLNFLFQTDGAGVSDGWTMAIRPYNTSCVSPVYIDSEGVIEMRTQRSGIFCTYLIVPALPKKYIEIKVDNISIPNNFFLIIYDSIDEEQIGSFVGQCNDIPSYCGTSWWTTQGNGAYVVFSTNSVLTTFRIRYSTTDSNTVSVIGPNTGLTSTSSSSATSSGDGEGSIANSSNAKIIISLFFIAMLLFI